MFNIKELVFKANIFKVHALQYFHISYKRRYSTTTNSELDADTSKQLVNHCMLIGYSGSKYFGMQCQRGKEAITVEGILSKAMLESNWVAQASNKHPRLIRFQEASRTDKGVSAARQCCSILLPAGLDIQDVNSKLPEDIRVFGLKRVTDKFNARRYCTARTYTYTLPSLAFSHYNDQMSQREYRISSDKLRLINELLQVYIGTKNFHNFTMSRIYSEKAFIRHMQHVNVSPPFLVGDVEFCVISIKGNSFMMYQIRKMIGLILAVIREVIDASIFDAMFKRENEINCPTAPGLGLVLNRQHFDEYDRHYGSDGSYEKLTWEDCDESVQHFHGKFIQSNIVQSEIQNEHMYEWLENLLNYTYIPETNSDSVTVSHEGYI